MNTARIYLLDTSGLVKRYHPEAGREKVQAVFALSDKTILISDLTIIETHSFVGRKIRTQTLNRADAASILAQFHNDIVHTVLQVVRVSTAHKRLGVELLDRHAPKRALRTLDALQLAVAVDLHEQGRLTYLVTADSAFGKVAEMAGIAVINPEA